MNHHNFFTVLYHIGYEAGPLRTLLINTICSPPCQELNRIMRVGGRYVCVSLLQEHILEYLLEWFPKYFWMIRVCRYVLLKIISLLTD